METAKKFLNTQTHSRHRNHSEVGKPKVAELRDGAHFHSPKSSRLAKFSLFRFSPSLFKYLRELHRYKSKIQRKYFILYSVEGVNGFLSIPHLVQRALTTAFCTRSILRSFTFRMHTRELKHEMEIFLCKKVFRS